MSSLYPRTVELPYEEILDAVNDIVYTRDLKGVFTSMNAAGARFFGRTREEMVGTTLHDAFGDPDLRSNLDATNAKLLAGGTDRSTVELVDAAGRRRVLETNTSLLRDRSGTPVGACGIMRDVTEATEAARQLEEALGRLRDIDRIKAGFAAMLAHDLRSPLGTVSIALDLLSCQLKARGMSDLLPIAESATISSGGIVTLVDEMLYIFRTDSGEIELDLAPTELVPLLRETLTGLAAQASRAGVRLGMKVLDPLVPLRADAGQLRRVFTNLVTNAIKFTPQGGEVKVLLSRTGPRAVEVRVSDTGEGISPDCIAYVFDPYFQAPSKRARFGTGLGLAIVKRIVDAHGGKVRVESVPGQGSVFIVELESVASGIWPVISGWSTLMGNT